MPAKHVLVPHFVQVSRVHLAHRTRSCKPRSACTLKQLVRATAASQTDEFVSSYAKRDQSMSQTESRSSGTTVATGHTEALESAEELSTRQTAQVTVPPQQKPGSSDAAGDERHASIVAPAANAEERNRGSEAPPAIAVSGDDEPRAKKFLVAVDASPGSIVALECVVSTMAAKADTIILLHAYPDVEILYPYRSAPVHMLAEAQARHKRSSEQLLRRLAEPLEELQMHVKEVAVMGDARDALQDAAKTVEPDFVVVGSRGFGVVKRALLGSVSDYAARHVECPVLIVKQPPSSMKQSWATIPGLEKLRNLAAQAA